MSIRRGLGTAAVFILAALAAVSASAQTTGSIVGIVFDQNGAPVAGATVKVSGEMLPAGRSLTTPASGQYAFTQLRPGLYLVEVTKEGVGDNKRQAMVEVDKTSTIDLVLGLAVKESIEVSAGLPVVDLKSTEVDTNYKSDTIAALPLERSYAGLFQLIPGVAENRSFAPAAGGTRQDNTYMLDGVNITNPGYGYLSSEVNELDIQEVNVKRAGVSAEFGRAVGVVTNAVSKSGTNKFSGVGRVDFMPSSFVAGFKNMAFRDQTVVTNISPAIGAGGPVVKDQLFWYASARYFKQTRWDQVNKLAETLPDWESKGHELHAKLTANLFSKNLINISYRDRPNKVYNDGLGASTKASVGTNDDNGSKVASASWAYFLTSRSSVEVKGLYMREQNESLPMVDLGYLPSWNPNNLTAMGYYTDTTTGISMYTGANPYTNTDNYRRHEVKGTFSQFFDVGKTNHELKIGGGYEFGEEHLDRTSNGWGQLLKTTLSGVSAIRARYYSQQSPQLGQGRTWSIFVQDNITIATRLTVNAGVLLDRDDFGQKVPGSGGCPSTVTLKGGAAVYESSGDSCTFLRFNFGDEIQPRLGFTYNVRKDKNDKVYVNFGRYYAMDQKSSGRSLAPRRIYMTQIYFKASDGSVLRAAAPLASTTGKMIDPDIKPTYNDDIVAGYATPFGTHWSVEAFFMYRKTHNFIDDLPTIVPDSSYVAANLPCTRWDTCSSAFAKRDYKAFTVELARRMADRWSANISYTWSRFQGNYDLDYSGGAVYNTSSAIQDGPGLLVQDPYRYGPLMQDRPHVFKVLGSWMPIDNVTLGTYFRVQSGTPWNARAYDYEGYGLNYLEQAGTHRNKTWTNLDLLGSYRLHVNRATVTLEGRILNVFGNQTVSSVDSMKYLDLNTLSAAPWIGPYSLSNTAYGTPTGYTPPRRFVVAALVAF